MRGAQWFLPGSEVNELRRRALESLLAKREQPRPIPCAKVPQALLEAPARAAKQEGYAVRLAHAAQLPRETPQDAAWFIMPLAQWRDVPPELRSRTWLEAPRALFGGAEEASARAAFESPGRGLCGLCGGKYRSVYHAGGPAAGGRLRVECDESALCKRVRRAGCADADSLAGADAGGYGAHFRAGARAGSCLRAYAPDADAGHARCRMCGTAEAVTERASCWTGRACVFRCGCSGPAGARTVYNPIPIYMGDRLKELPVELPLLYFTNRNGGARAGGAGAGAGGPAF